MTQLTYEQIVGAVQGLPLLDRQRLLKLLLSQPELAAEQNDEGAVAVSIQERLAQDPNLRWLEEHREEYSGQWVALHNGQLIAHSFDGATLVEPVRKSGVRVPLIVFVESPGAELFVGF